jgi:hypothetical protein
MTYTVITLDGRELTLTQDELFDWMAGRLE